MNLQELLHQIETFEEREFYGPASDRMISAASSELGLRFPAQYIEFLSALGSGSISSESFIGLCGPRHLDIVWITKTLRSKVARRSFADSLLPIRSDGYGNYDCVDCTQPTSENEFTIVEWLHDGSDLQGNRILARSYFEWFDSILKMLKEID